MRIQLHGYSYGIENVEKHNISVSRLTNEKLHFIEIRLNIDNDEVQNFKKLFNECNNGDLVIIDQDPEIDNHRFKGKICSSSSSNRVDYNTFIIELEECSNKSIDKIEIEGMCLKPYEISQEISKNAVIINAKVNVDSEQFNIINKLNIREERYFNVKRLGIDDGSLQMRFGRNLWSEKDGNIKMALVLVEKEYDNTDDNYHGFSEPELSIAIKQIKQLRAINVRLLDILNENNLISKEQKEAIEMELTKEELKKESYIYSQVDDIDEWW